LFGNVKFPRTDEDYDVDSDEGNKFPIAADMNESAYTELILSIDDNISIGKLALNLVKGFKNKYHAV
jgi:hypothetical protein